MEGFKREKRLEKEKDLERLSNEDLIAMMPTNEEYDLYLKLKHDVSKRGMDSYKEFKFSSPDVMRQVNKLENDGLIKLSNHRYSIIEQKVPKGLVTRKDFEKSLSKEEIQYLRASRETTGIKYITEKEESFLLKLKDQSKSMSSKSDIINFATKNDVTISEVMYLEKNGFIKTFFEYEKEVGNVNEIVNKGNTLFTKDISNIDKKSLVQNIKLSNDKAEIRESIVVSVGCQKRDSIDFFYSEDPRVTSLRKDYSRKYYIDSSNAPLILSDIKKEGLKRDEKLIFVEEKIPLRIKEEILELSGRKEELGDPFLKAKALELYINDPSFLSNSDDLNVLKGEYIQFLDQEERDRVDFLSNVNDLQIGSEAQRSGIVFRHNKTKEDVFSSYDAYVKEQGIERSTTDVFWDFAEKLGVRELFTDRDLDKRGLLSQKYVGPYTQKEFNRVLESVNEDVRKNLNDKAVYGYRLCQDTFKKNNSDFKNYDSKLINELSSKFFGRYDSFSELQKEITKHNFKREDQDALKKELYGSIKRFVEIDHSPQVIARKNFDPIDGRLCFNVHNNDIRSVMNLSEDLKIDRGISTEEARSFILYRVKGVDGLTYKEKLMALKVANTKSAIDKINSSLLTIDELNYVEHLRFRKDKGSSVEDLKKYALKDWDISAERFNHLIEKGVIETSPITKNSLSESLEKGFRFKNEGEEIFAQRYIEGEYNNVKEGSSFYSHLVNVAKKEYSVDEKRLGELIESGAIPINNKYVQSIQYKPENVEFSKMRSGLHGPISQFPNLTLHKKADFKPVINSRKAHKIIEMLNQGNLETINKYCLSESYLYRNKIYPGSPRMVELLKNYKNLKYGPQGIIGAGIPQVILGRGIVKSDVLMEVNRFKQMTRAQIVKMGISNEELDTISSLSFIKELGFEGKFLKKHILPTIKGQLEYYSIEHDGLASGRGVLEELTDKKLIAKSQQKRKDLLPHDLKVVDAVNDAKERLKEKEVKILETICEYQQFGSSKTNVLNNQRTTEHFMDVILEVEDRQLNVLSGGNGEGVIAVEYGNYTKKRMQEKLQNSKFDHAYIYSNKTHQTKYIKWFGHMENVTFLTI
ncbi:hypothetical protein [Halobacteriovorax sp. CON-3]|uniref:hypothetical protein n=1 Tax=Halobacteriovorax sp. CON-3 TaxID=3157710 RepID=UPI003711F1F9